MDSLPSPTSRPLRDALSPRGLELPWAKAAWLRGRLLASWGAPRWRFLLPHLLFASLFVSPEPGTAALRWDWLVRRPT